MGIPTRPDTAPGSKRINPARANNSPVGQNYGAHVKRRHFGPVISKPGGRWVAPLLRRRRPLRRLVGRDVHDFRLLGDGKKVIFQRRCPPVVFRLVPVS